MTAIRDRDAMIAGMAPCLMPGHFHFCTITDPALIGQALPLAIGTFHEAEGISLILPEAAALALGLPIGQPMRQITLQVYSALAGVGLTAAVSGVLAAAGIACNMVAAFHHDHAFVPAADALRAIDLLARRAADHKANAP